MDFHFFKVSEKSWKINVEKEGAPWYILNMSLPPPRRLCFTRRLYVCQFATSQKTTDRSFVIFFLTQDEDVCLEKKVTIKFRLLSGSWSASKNFWRNFFTTLPIFARNRKNSAYTLLITRRQILMTFFQDVMSHQQQTNFGADLERDPYTGIFNGISLSRDRSNCKIFASNSINNDYNVWKMSCVVGGMCSPSAIFYLILLL